MSRSSILGAMLFVPAKILDLDEELSCGNGVWSRAQLIEMDARFCEALERAFEAGLESRAAARATYAVNGKRRVMVDEVIEAAWCSFRDAKFDMTAAAVLARCPGITSERVREGIKRRFVSWIGEAR